MKILFRIAIASLLASILVLAVLPTPQRLFMTASAPTVEQQLYGSGSDELQPAVMRPHLPHGEHFVPLIRFTMKEVSPDTERWLSGRLREANQAGAEAIVLELATPGGSVLAGQEMARDIERSRAPVYCVADGEVASMGFYVLQACRVRLMTRRSALMVHEPAIVGASNMSGKQTDWRNVQRSLHATSEAMLQHEAHRLKITVAELRQHIEHGQDWWMLWNESLTVGAVDGVVWSVDAVQHSLQHQMKFHAQMVP